jgi:serine/threonine protein phosphatase PrpC
VGDCHYHAIVAKWTALQGHALRIVEEYPNLVHKVHYESILQDKESVVKGIYTFIGERRFGGVKRQASVLFMSPAEDLINGAKTGREATKAQSLSYQFENLGRGPSFAQQQNQKWRDPVTGLDQDNIQLVESVAYEMMQKLGYKTHLVGVVAEPSVFSQDDLRMFHELNKQGIQKMRAGLKVENPGDFERRANQAETLSLLPMLLEDWNETDLTKSEHHLLGNCFLSEEDLLLRLEVAHGQTSSLSCGKQFRWAAASQRGYYPEEAEKPNQDSCKCEAGIANGGNLHWFSVFDGHGPDGHTCSQYAAELIPKLFVSELSRGVHVRTSIERAHIDTHKHMLAESTIDVRQSGTTAVSFLLDNNKCLVANVGDSACILGSRTDGGGITTKKLCSEHTPFRADERERVKKAGGVIMTVDQRDGMVPVNENWDDSQAPPRIWSAEDDKFPGCGFTRSIGDSVAHSLGVTARPEIFEHTLDKKDCIVIVASDGITECECN